MSGYYSTSAIPLTPNLLPPDYQLLSILVLFAASLVAIVIQVKYVYRGMQLRAWTRGDEQVEVVVVRGVREVWNEMTEMTRKQLKVLFLPPVPAHERTATCTSQDIAFYIHKPNLKPASPVIELHIDYTIQPAYLKAYKNVLAEPLQKYIEAHVPAPISGSTGSIQQRAVRSVFAQQAMMEQSVTKIDEKKVKRASTTIKSSRLLSMQVRPNDYDIVPADSYESVQTVTSFSTSVSGSQMHCLSAVLPVEFPDTSESTDSHLSKRYPFVFVLVGKDSEGSCLAICRKVENGRISGRDFQLYYIGAQRILRELQDIYGDVVQEEGEEAPSSPKKADAEDSVCVVCLSDPRTMVFLPCRHLCICADCWADFAKTGTKTCPVCRSAYEGTLFLGD